MQNIIANIVSDFSTLTGIACAVRPDGTVTVPAGDVPKLAALARIATSGTSRHHVIPAATTTGRAGVDWAEAGRKSWETRRRNAESKDRRPWTAQVVTT